jgi:hypothetical protein
VNWKEKLHEWFIPKNPVQWMILIGLLLFVIYQELKVRRENDEIDKYAAETPGILVDYHHSGGSDRTSVFEYWVDGRKYTAYAGGHRFGDCVRTRDCIGVRYMIRYSSIHPEKGGVLWNQPLPRLDSLQKQ